MENKNLDLKKMVAGGGLSEEVARRIFGGIEADIMKAYAEDVPDELPALVDEIRGINSALAHLATHRHADEKQVRAFLKMHLKNSKNMLWYLFQLTGGGG